MFRCLKFVQVYIRQCGAVVLQVGHWTSNLELGGSISGRSVVMLMQQDVRMHASVHSAV